MPSPELEPKLEDEDYAVLHSAVTIARVDGIKTVRTLRSRLAKIYPNSEAQIKRVILFWAYNNRIDPE